MKKFLILIIGVYLLGFSFSCRKKDKDDCPYCPKIDELVPATGKKGDTVRIKGRNFSETLLENIVSFNGVKVPASSMISGSSTELKVLVPPKCGTGEVEVKLDDELYSSNGPTFTYDYQTIVTTITGSGSFETINGVLLSLTHFKHPTQLAMDGPGNIYVLDTGNAKVIKLDLSTGYNKVILDNNSQVSKPTAFTIDPNNVLYISNYSGGFTGTATIYKVTPGSNIATYYSTDPDAGKKHISLACEGVSKFYIGRITTNISVPFYDITHYTPTNGHLHYASGGGAVVYLKNDYLYHINSLSAKIYQTEFLKIHISDTVTTTILDKTAGLNFSTGLVVDDAGNAYIADTQNNRILKCTPSGVVTTLVSTGLKEPRGMVMDRFGNIYVADSQNQCIKKITFD